MRKLLVLFLLCSSISYGQSFFDTTIGGGINSEKNPFGAMELRYSLPLPLVKNLWISPSMKIDVDIFENQLNPSFRLGGTYSPIESIMITGGGYLNQVRVGYWFDFFVRTDVKLIKTEEGWVGGTLNVERDNISVGIVFKDFIIKI